MNPVVIGNATHRRRAAAMAVVRMKSHYRHMTPKAAKAIRDLYYVGKLKQRDIGRMFGVRQNSVSRVISGRVWV